MSAQQNNQKHSINSLVVVDELFAGVWPFWEVEGLRWLISMTGYTKYTNTDETK